MKKTISAVVALMLGASLAVAAPHGGKGGRHGKRGEFGETLAQKLNLSDTQTQQIRALELNFREQNKAFFESSRETMKQYRDARKANDTAKINALQPTVDAARAQMKQLREAKRQQFMNLLTPEQRTQFEALEAEHESRRGEKKNWK